MTQSEKERIDDAVYLVAVNRYVTERTERGEPVSVLAAEKIAALAAIERMYPARDLRLFGFKFSGRYLDPLPQDAMWGALDRVNSTGSTYLVQRLRTLFEARSVEELERLDVYHAPGR